MKSGIKITGTGVLAGVGLLGLVFAASRASAATRGALDFGSEDNVINNTVEHVTGFSLTRFGERIGGAVYDITRGDNTPADWLGLR